MRNIKTKRIAICGVTAALAVVIMSIGGMIPVATYTCPMLCILIGNVVFQICGMRFAWTWYGAVAILCAILCPDKEAAAVYILLGYYPYIKPYIDKLRFKVLIKLIYFNASAFALYAVLLYVLGLSEIAQDFQIVGLVGVCIILLLGNVTFFILDLLLKASIKLKQ